jgi:hypothetical protein
MSAEKFTPVMVVGPLRHLELSWKLTLTSAEDIQPPATSNL